MVNNLSATVCADHLTLEIPDGAYVIDYDDEPVDLLPLGFGTLARDGLCAITSEGQGERQVDGERRAP